MKKLFFGFLLIVAQGCATTPKGDPGRNTACDSEVRNYRLYKIEHIKAVNAATAATNRGETTTKTMTDNILDAQRNENNYKSDMDLCLRENGITESSVPMKDDERAPALLERTTPTPAEE